MDTFRALVISRSDEDDGADEDEGEDGSDDTPRPLFTDDCEGDYRRDAEGEA